MSPSDWIEHRELIAAHARHDVARIDRRAQTPGNLREDEIARSMPERFVDLLEVLEIDEEHGEERVEQRARFRETAAQPVFEERAVGQPGQSVMRLVVRDAPLGVLECGLVAEHADGKARMSLLVHHDRDGCVGPHLVPRRANATCCSNSNVSRSPFHSASSSTAYILRARRRSYLRTSCDRLRLHP